MKKKLLFSATASEKRVALLENDKVVELAVERPDQYRIVGNIYRGRIESILPGLQAAFVDLGMERSAFLHASDVDPSLLLEQNSELMDHRGHAEMKRRRVPSVPIEKVLDVGQAILVQVTKEPIGTKGPKVTTQISLAGRFLVLVPDTDFIGVSKKTSDDTARKRLKKLIAGLKPPGVGFIVRTIGLEVSEKEFVAEIHSLIDTWRSIQNSALEGSGPKLIHRELGITTRVVRDFLSEEVTEVHVDNKDDYAEILTYLASASPHLRERVFLYTEKRPLFDKFNIEKDLELSLKRKVWLRSGGYILLDHAEALLAIDVNTGRNVGKSNLEQTILQTNMDAALEIGRQLRLRDIGGIIVVDFIDMRIAENRRKVENQMRAVLKADPTVTSSGSLTKFGLMEITRKRVRPELQELYTDVCHACNGLGWVFSPAAITARIERWLKRANVGQIPHALTLAVHPAVAAYLQKDAGDMIRRLEEQNSVKLRLVEDPSLDQDEYDFYPEGETKPITSMHQ